VEDLGNFIEALAEPTPAPGGGSSAGVTVAIAAALVEMSAGIARESDAASVAAALRTQALKLAEEELASYAPVLDARTPEERATALAAASEPPARIAETGAEVAELGVRVASVASEAVRGDALTGVVLAEAAASAAFRLVQINIGSGPVFERAQAAEARAVRARASATGHPPPAARAPTPS
jgi:formiminotetrahydrofolate cyclodeaminase